MRVAIDAHMVGEHETGNEAYVLGLIEGLVQLSDDVSYDLLTNPGRGTVGAFPQDVRFSPIAVRPRTPWLRIPIALPWLVRRRKADVLHVTYNAPPFAPCPTVVTIHDLSFRFLPRLFSRRDRVILSALVPPSARRAAFVLTPSAHSKRDIVRDLGIPSERVVVTPEAARPQFRGAADPKTIASALDRYGITPPYVLAIGSLEPRKNLLRLLTAMAKVSADDSVPAHTLVIAGPGGRMRERIIRKVRQLGLTGQVVLTDYVREPDVPLLYQGATCLAYVTLYEGFGLPVLEAMESGVPVVASSSGAIPEVAGDAALLVNPRSSSEIAGALARLLRDPELQANLRRAGRARAQMFTWRETARRTLEVYREAAKMGTRYS